jgi:hypothetical protein
LRILTAKAVNALTRVIDQLAERGLLERIRRDRDRRKVDLQLTANGRGVIQSLIPLVVEKLNLALADFSSAAGRGLPALADQTQYHAAIDRRAGNASSWRQDSAAARVGLNRELIWTLC